MGITTNYEGLLWRHGLLHSDSFLDLRIEKGKRTLDTQAISEKIDTTRNLRTMVGSPVRIFAAGDGVIIGAYAMGKNLTTNDLRNLVPCRWNDDGTYVSECKTAMDLVYAD